jgi:DNA topoisomerase-1
MQLSHLQATGGWDARGRKQYRYHPARRQIRPTAKFAELAGSCRAWVRYAAADRDLRLNDPRHDRCRNRRATARRLMSLRIGNAKVRPQQQVVRSPTQATGRAGSVGAARSTSSSAVKSSHDFDVTVDSRARQDSPLVPHLPGQQLFNTRTSRGGAWSGSPRLTYPGNHARPGSTAKTFRTWNATVRAAEACSMAGKRALPTPHRSSRNRHMITLLITLQHASSAATATSIRCGRAPDGTWRCAGNARSANASKRTVGSEKRRCDY